MEAAAAAEAAKAVTEKEAAAKTEAAAEAAAEAEAAKVMADIEAAAVKRVGEVGWGLTAAARWAFMESINQLVMCLLMRKTHTRN